MRPRSDSAVWRSCRRRMRRRFRRRYRAPFRRAASRAPCGWSVCTARASPASRARLPLSQTAAAGRPTRWASSSSWCPSTAQRRGPRSHRQVRCAAGRRRGRGAPPAALPPRHRSRRRSPRARAGAGTPARRAAPRPTPRRAFSRGTTALKKSWRSTHSWRRWPAGSWATSTAGPPRRCGRRSSPTAPPRSTASLACGRPLRRSRGLAVSGARAARRASGTARASPTSARPQTPPP
mmetsp:Transcript_4396/g.13292  ORF Transcript_4396/g.13292 Transcript_4396/m.13292 type:complete len:236 (+) Transcript_4396:1286-1993(+)